MNPTPEQTAIISAARTDASIMVEALAGTGKTKTLELLVPELGASTSRPSSILALAFNVKIKNELAERLPTSVGSAKVEVKTLNGLGHGALYSWLRKPLSVDTRKTVKLLADFESRNGVRFSKDESSTIYDLVAAAKALGWVPSTSPMPGSPIYKDDPEGISAVFEWAEAEERDDLTVALRALMTESIRLGLYRGEIDFNDQIYLPVIFKAPFRKYHTVLVDEVQDLSYLNHLMLERSCGSRMIAVGDSNQAIYAFRGALTNSMDLLAETRDFIRLPLTMTFRCGRRIVERQQAFVPDYTAAPSNPEGEIIQWGEGLAKSSWSTSDIPLHAAIICRNNAPLIKLAFKLMRQGRGIQMLGNDLGKSLERALDVSCKGLPSGTSFPQMKERIDKYFERELAKAKTDKRKESLQDRWDCVSFIAEGAGTLVAARRTCHSLFENPDAVVTLSSGHKAKGLEWDCVIHLDPWRVPSKYATTPEAIRQEKNLRYVIETRPKHTLILANLEDFT